MLCLTWLLFVGLKFSIAWGFVHSLKVERGLGGLEVFDVDLFSCFFIILCSRLLGAGWWTCLFWRLGNWELMIGGDFSHMLLVLILPQIEEDEGEGTCSLVFTMFTLISHLPQFPAPKASNLLLSLVWLMVEWRAILLPLLFTIVFHTIVFHCKASGTLLHFSVTKALLNRDSWRGRKFYVDCTEII